MQTYMLCRGHISSTQQTVLYSVLQSDRNSFGGKVVLDSVNMASKDAGSISDEMYKSLYVRIFIMVIFL